MTEQIQHTPGPWAWEIERSRVGSLTCFNVAKSNLELAKLWAHQVAGVKLSTRQQRHNAQLIALAPTAPHSCDVPDCPGPKNQAKLQAAEYLAHAAEFANSVLAPLDMEHDDVATELQMALAAWNEANQ